MNKEEAKFRAVLKETESLAQEVMDWWESPHSPSDKGRKMSEGELKHTTGQCKMRQKKTHASFKGGAR
jgi:hypothetical protein